jgi:cholesterol transport system auxiliary component
MKKFPQIRFFFLCISIAISTLASSCKSLLPAAVPPPTFYSLISAPTDVRTAIRAPLSAAAPTLIVSLPQAAPGYDSRRIIYLREPYKLEYFARSEWVDTPARMLAPLIVDAVEKSGAFRAVVLAPSAAAGELRLDTELLRLQQNFGGTESLVRFTLRAHVLDNTTRKVLATREFDVTAACESEDTYGGVAAANRAAQAALEQLASFCSETAANWQVPLIKPKNILYLQTYSYMY